MNEGLVEDSCRDLDAKNQYQLNPQLLPQEGLPPLSRQRNIPNSAEKMIIADEVATQLQLALRPILEELHVMQNSSTQYKYQVPNVSSNALDLTFKRNKAFKQILDARATVFDGSSRLQYLDWKEALQREVLGLNLTAYQWMDLLQVRTTNAAFDVIQPARILQRETSPEQALELR